MNQKPIEEFRGRHRFLSNFFPVDFGVVLDDGETYPTIEHAYQAAKTFSPAQRTLIRISETPGEAKRYGRKVTLRTDWDAVKDDIMLDLVRQKFANAQLRELLLDTGEAELVEGNDWGDTYWGKYAGVGQNKLGKILMRVRSEIRREKIK